MGLTSSSIARTANRLVITLWVVWKKLLWIDVYFVQTYISINLNVKLFSASNVAKSGMKFETAKLFIQMLFDALCAILLVIQAKVVLTANLITLIIATNL